MRMFLIIFLIITCVIIFHPGRHAKYYTYIETSEILNEIVPNVESSSNLTNCGKNFYKNLLQESKTETTSIDGTHTFIKPLIGGEHQPKECTLFKVAVIVPYRNRAEQLQLFLNYMHDFLQRQRLHYRILIVEQNNNNSFNRALMLNVGANEAMKMNFTCLILHDVDLFPTNSRNLYACFKKPRHMSSSVDIFRYNLPYLTLFGGVVALQLKHFKQINGMSNVFEGWGGEDDDFYTRLKEYNLLPFRLSPELSTYKMLPHKRQLADYNRWKKLENSVKRQAIDGLNSIPNNYKVELEHLYTHILV